MATHRVSTDLVFVTEAGDQRRVSTDLAYVTEAGDARRVSTDMVYVTASPTDRRVSTDLVFVTAQPVIPFTGPSSLVATAVAFNQMSLAWTRPLSATQQEVHRSPTASFTPSAATLVDTIGGGVDVYTDTIPTFVGEEDWFYIIVATDGVTTAQTNEDGDTTPTAPPSTPILSHPLQDQLITDDFFYINHSQSIDPEGDPVTYTARYKKVTDATWNNAFVNRSVFTPFLVDPYVYSGDGTYELELWANDGQVNSVVVAITFEVNQGAPSAPQITNPQNNDTVTPTTLDVTWIHPTDPQSDPLTIHLRYKKDTDPGYTNIDTVVDTDPPLYSWDISALVDGTYYLDMWADDGTVDGPHTTVQFFVAAIARPSVPLIRLHDITLTSVRVTLDAYYHPQNVPHKETIFQIMPVDATVPTKEITLDASILEYTFVGLISNFDYKVLVYTVDDNDQVSDAAKEEFITLVDPALTGIPRRYSSAGGMAGRFWETVADVGASYATHRTGQTHVEPAALGFNNFGELGSCILKCAVRIEGNNDPELAQDFSAFLQHYWPSEWLSAGVGLTKGRDVDNNMHGVAVLLGFGLSWPADPVMTWLWQPGLPFMHGSMHSNSVQLAVDGRMTASEGLIPNAGGMEHVLLTTFEPQEPRLPEYVRNKHYSKHVWYSLTVVIERFFEPVLKTVVSVNVGTAPGVKAPWTAVPQNNGFYGQWELLDYTVCGYPSVVFSRGAVAEAVGTGPNTRRGAARFTSLLVIPLKDDGIDNTPITAPPPTPSSPSPASCSVASEDAQPDAVFFPLGPTWDSPFEDMLRYLTDVIASEDDTEQRLQLRDTPSRVITYSVLTQDVRGSSTLMHLLWDLETVWAFGYWPDAQALLVDLPAGSTSIDIVTLDTNEFQNTDTFVLWKNEFEYEVVTGSIAGTVVTFDDPTVNDWSRFSTWIVPVLKGRIIKSPEIDRPATFAAEMKVSFVTDIE